jgi:hypothetical protein
LSEERRLRVFENTALREIFGSKRDEVTGEWRKIHKEQLNDLYCSPKNFRVIKSIRKKRSGHVVCMWKRRGAYSILLRKSEEKRSLIDLDVDGRKILRWIFRKWDVGYGLDRAGSG